jgi:hypothetical protein
LATRASSYGDGGVLFFAGFSEREEDRHWGGGEWTHGVSVASLEGAGGAGGVWRDGDVPS